MTLTELLRRTQEWFAGLGIATARLDAEVLIAHGLQIERIAFYTDGQRILTKDELGACRELVKRRAKREPVAYIVGEREFWSRPFAVDARVLIPRPDTETLVDLALTWLDGPVQAEIVVELEEHPDDDDEPAFGEYTPGVDTVVELLEPTAEEVAAGASPTEPEDASPPDASAAFVLDYGTGSGAIAVTLAAERPTLKVLAIDLSADALEVAKENAARHAVTDRVGFVCSDGFTRVPPRFHGQLAAIVANPPYVPVEDEAGLAPDVRDHEPREALFAGPDPLLHYRRIAEEARRWLRPGGFVALEVGKGQADDVRGLFTGWSQVEVRKDLAGIERVVAARL